MGGEDVQAERRAPERPRGDAGHHGHYPARAPWRGRALPDGWPCVGGRSADHLLKLREWAPGREGLVISSVRCSSLHFCQIFCMIFNLVHVYTYFVVGTILQCTCTEKHSICKCLRRIPSLCLVPSVELAFAARCMHARITAMTNATKCVVLPSEHLGRSCRQLGSRFFPLRWISFACGTHETSRCGSV